MKLEEIKMNKILKRYWDILYNRLSVINYLIIEEYLVKQ